MPRRDINKSFRLDSEPCLLWPKSPAKLLCAKGFRLECSRGRMTYSIHPDKAGSVSLVGWDYTKGFASFRDVFSASQSGPVGLIALASLNDHFNPQNVCKWVSHNGLLGFSMDSLPVAKGGFPIHATGVNGVVIYSWEPIDCIRIAAQRAVNVLALWSALKDSYKTGEQAIRSIVTMDKHDASRVDSGPIKYSTFVNRECRNQWPAPETKRDWRRLANLLLSEYIQEHIFKQIEVGIGIQGQNKEEGVRNAEPSPDWNLKPTWSIQSALAAYYVELLMVMRRFRSCKTCGADISHQRDKSIYCSPSSTCRSKQWHRQEAAKKRSLIGA